MYMYVTLFTALKVQLMIFFSERTRETTHGQPVSR